MKHFWFGKLITDQQLEIEMSSIEKVIPEILRLEISTYQLLTACEKLANQLIDKSESYQILKNELLKIMNEEESNQTMLEIAYFLNPDSLKYKLKREIDCDEINDLTRISFKRNLFESWSPLGVLTHIAPGNSPALSFLALVEGLLTGNKNILKLSSKDSRFCILAMTALGKCDQTGVLNKTTIILRISSSNQKMIKRIISVSDGVSVWGGDEAIKSIKKMMPTGTRLIPWGHKVSFGLVSKDKIKCDETIEKMAMDCVLMEQQACSSPQTILLETSSTEELDNFSKSLLKQMEKLSQSLLDPVLSIQEQAEITNISEVVRLETVLGKGKLLQSGKLNCRVFIDYTEGLSLSPLYRSIWVRPITKEKLIEKLYPLRQYLQTCGLACSTSDIFGWTQRLIQAGVLRITNPGEMLSSYDGEPHDGVYAVNRFMKRVRCEHSSLDNHYRLSSLIENTTSFENTDNGPIMNKEDFHKQVPDQHKSKLYFRSGGSSGKPAISTFSYEDYHSQMQAAAEGLFSAGLDPENDRVMNLFFGGGLYGGFISFFTILEKLNAVQFPMQAIDDLTMVAETIIENKINVLIGMPSYLLGLFKENKKLFKEYRIVKKIFFGGEHLLPSQKNWLKEEFGIEVIRAASYGSVDAGPLGYQCQYMNNSEYHLNNTLHILEVLSLESDAPAKINQIGRLIFTSMKRNTQEIKRYDVGDLGKAMEGQCPCGKQTKRFELLGRSGDLFRAAGTFFNYQKFSKILIEELNYSGELQIIISKTQDQSRDQLIIYLDKENITNKPTAEIFILNYKDLKEAVALEKCLDFVIEPITHHDFERVATSGKLLRVLDLR
jgi:phenylacetate-coenzyme A ligase PaaK-like adenylate-forming protein